MLNPYVVFAGSSWWNILPAAAWLPWLLRWSAELVDFSSRYAMPAVCAARVLLFFAGNVQFFIYSVLAEILFITLREVFSAEKKISRAALQTYILSYIITLVLSLPLLLPLIQQVRLSGAVSHGVTAEQVRIGANNVLMWFAGVVCPFSSQWLKDPLFSSVVEMFVPRNSWQVWFLPYFSHIGYAAFALCLLCWLPAKKREDTRYGIISALLGLGFLCWSFGVLDGVTGAIPVLRSLRYPFKVLMFANFFFILLACVNLSSVNEWCKRNRRAKWLFTALVAFQLTQLLLLYAVSPRRNFFTYSGAVPITEPALTELAGGRVFSAGLPQHDGVAPLVGYNYASLFGLFHFGGYDPFTPRYNTQITGSMGDSGIVNVTQAELHRIIPLLRQWGVRSYAVTSAGAVEYDPVFSSNGVARALSDERRVIYHDPAALPMAYLVANGSGEGIKYRIGINAITVESDLPKGGPVAVAFAYNPQFKVYVDGREMPVMRTKMRQLGVYMGSGRHTAVFKYSDPLFCVGLWLAAVFVALAVFYKTNRWFEAAFRKRFSDYFK